MQLSRKLRNRWPNGWWIHRYDNAQYEFVVGREHLGAYCELRKWPSQETAEAILKEIFTYD